MPTIKDVIIEIPIDLSVRPVAQPYRRIPIPLEERVLRKLDELEELGIIEKVNEPSPWISAMVVDGVDREEIRLCIDLRQANKAVIREKHPLPTMESFLPKISKSKVFSRLDLRKAFHQLLLAEKSRYITTFITSRGLYRYTRLMFGISCAPEIFQKIFERILLGCDGVINFIDDILIYGENKNVHDSRLAAVLKRLKEYNVTLNDQKCVYGVPELEYLGFKLSSRGVDIASSKLKAIKAVRPPKDSSELRSFLGLVQYIAKFIPNMSTINEPLRKLLKKGSHFEFGVEQMDAFNKLKEILTNRDTLGYYDPKNKTRVIADASPVGLGAVLVQLDGNEYRIICYASKSLSNQERKYAQTEKEALALVWAVEKFHMYLYGKTFELITDHRPLEVLFGPNSRPCARIERWVLRMQSYSYKVIYQPGKSNIADPLSRMCVDNEAAKESFDEATEIYVQFIVKSARPIAIPMKTIEVESKKDEELGEINKALESGKWPESLRKYKLIEDELCFSKNILLRGTRIVIPQSLQEKTLCLAHEGHPGIVAMKQRLRSKVWWYGIDKMAEDTVKKCLGCIIDSRPDPPIPMKRRELPKGPWTDLAIDFLGPLPEGKYILVIVDYYSRFVVTAVLKEITSKNTIKELRRYFEIFGNPITITSDNGRQFVSEEFRNFCTTEGITLNTTVPYWPQQNGEVERQNRSLLKKIRISHAEGKDWQEEMERYLMMYRAIIHTTTGKTPAELLFGRNIRDKLPSLEKRFDDEELRDKDRERKDKGKERADRKRKAMDSKIKTGDTVVMKRMKKTNKLDTSFDHEKYKVLSRTGGDTIVKSGTGRMYRRNVSDLKLFPAAQGNYCKESPIDLERMTVEDIPSEEEDEVVTAEIEVRREDAGSTSRTLTETDLTATGEVPKQVLESVRPRRMRRAPTRYPL